MAAKKKGMAKRKKAAKTGSANPAAEEQIANVSFGSFSNDRKGCQLKTDQFVILLRKLVE